MQETIYFLPLTNTQLSKLAFGIFNIIMYLSYKKNVLTHLPIIKIRNLVKHKFD